jgi:hypothetical protein
MKVKILRDGPYSDMSRASRGKKVFHLKAGDEVDLLEAYAKGLEESGLVEILEPELEPEVDPEAEDSEEDETQEPEAGEGDADADGEKEPEVEAAPKPKISRSKSSEKAEPKEA